MTCRCAVSVRRLLASAFVAAIVTAVVMDLDNVDGHGRASGAAEAWQASATTASVRRQRGSKRTAPIVPVGGDVRREVRNNWPEAGATEEDIAFADVGTLANLTAGWSPTDVEPVVSRRAIRERFGKFGEGSTSRIEPPRRFI